MKNLSFMMLCSSITMGQNKMICPKVQIFCENKAAAAERGKVLEEKEEEGEKVRVVQDHILSTSLAGWMNLFYFCQ